MNEQVLVKNLDLSWIIITGIDNETMINRSALITLFRDVYPAFGVANGGFLLLLTNCSI